MKQIETYDLPKKQRTFYFNFIKPYIKCNDYFGFVVGINNRVYLCVTVFGYGFDSGVWLKKIWRVGDNNGKMSSSTNKR